MLGHELRNPLSPILTALQLMKLRNGGALERERTVIERQVTHLTRLVDDLLDVSRIARGKVELKLEVVELAEIVMRAVEVASPLLESRSQTLVMDVARSGLPVQADPARLAQVVSNLLTNAAKYTPPSGRVTIATEREGADVVLRVQDTGIGIAPDVLPRIFDLFVQGGQSLDRAQGGLGLGLTIVKSLVERHGGSVSVHSEGPNLGSEFVVTLPLALEASRQVDVPIAGRSARARFRVAPRILIVDDNHDAAEMLAEVLRARGYETRIAHDGPEALRVATAFKPEAAFLDIGLPVMDGYELASRLRELPGLSTVRLIAVTGYGQESDRRRTEAAGFEHHMVKPVDLEVLEDLVNSIGA
jgi:CheY-like chemotaxis protein